MLIKASVVFARDRVIAVSLYKFQTTNFITIEDVSQHKTLPRRQLIVTFNIISYLESYY